VHNAVSKELEFTENVMEDYEGFSGITEMAMNKDVLVEK
jgi:hypothetical protein